MALQELWDQYRLLVAAIGEHCDELEYEPSVQRLIDVIADCDEMACLRDELFKAGVQNIPGLDYTKQPQPAEPKSNHLDCKERSKCGGYRPAPVCQKIHQHGCFEEIG